MAFQRRQRQTPYPMLPPKTIKVIGLKNYIKVQQWEFTEDEVRPAQFYNNVVAAVSDGTSVIKCILFEDLASQIHEGKSYLIKNYAMTQFGSHSTMLTRKNTAIYV